MKNIRCWIIVVLLIMVLFCMVSCGTSVDVDSTPSTDISSSATEELTVLVKLPYISDEMRLNMPQMRPEMNSTLAVFEQEIDTFMASFMVAHSNYLSNENLGIYADLFRLICDEYTDLFDRISETLSKYDSSDSLISKIDLAILKNELLSCRNSLAWTETECSRLDWGWLDNTEKASLSENIISCTNSLSKFFYGVNILQTDAVEKHEDGTEQNLITVSNMKDGIPYLLMDGEIQRIKQITVDRGMISEKQVNGVPKVSKYAKIIVRMEKSDFDEASLTQLLISPEENGYTNSPYVDFSYIDGKVYLKLTSGTYEVDNINGIKEYENMPLVHNVRFASDVNSYMLYSMSGATKYVVGYWEGTQYKETEVDISYTAAKYDNKSKYRCDFSKTYDGYFILNLPDLIPGYYVMGGFRNDQNKLESYVIYFE